MHCPVFRSCTSLLPQSKIKTHLISLPESSFKSSNAAFPSCLPELFIWCPGPAVVYCEVSKLKGMGFITHWEGTHSGDTKERGDGESINKVSMFLKGKTLDCGKHKITLENIQTLRSKMCFPAEELVLFLMDTIQYLWMGFHILLFFFYCQVTHLHESSSCTFSFVMVSFLGWSLKHIFLRLSTDSMSICYSVPQRELNSNFRGGLVGITDNWIMSSIPLGTPPII